MIARYCRVSTTDQTLQRQITATSDYAREQPGAELDELETFRDQSTGTNTSREGYLALMDAVEDGLVEAVVATGVSRIARSIRDLDRTAERTTEAGAELHVIDGGLVLAAYHEKPESPETSRFSRPK